MIDALRRALGDVDSRIKSAPRVTDSEYVLLAMPDMNGYLRGKALSRDAFEAAAEDGTVMTDLLLGLDPVDAPMPDYEDFGSVRARATSSSTGCRDAPRAHLEAGLERLPRDALLAGRLAVRACVTGGAWTRPRRHPRARLRDAGRVRVRARIWDAEGRPLSSGISYSILEAGGYHELVSASAPALEALGVELTADPHRGRPPASRAEPGRAGRRLRAADDAALVKLAVKGVAETLGLRASFLAKTVPGEEGSSGHLHLSSGKTSTNAFAARRRVFVPTPAAQAVAGILDHLAGASLLLNPTVNSYKRLVPGWFAPVNASWGIENRSAALRVISRPQTPSAAASSAAARARTRTRTSPSPRSRRPPGEGLRRERSQPRPWSVTPMRGTTSPALPGSLESALAAFRADDELRAGLGERFSDYFATSREWELRAWRDSVATGSASGTSGSVRPGPPQEKSG